MQPGGALDAGRRGRVVVSHPPTGWDPEVPRGGEIPGPGAPRPAKAGNGLAVTAMVLGIVGTVLGLVFSLFFLAIPFGVLAVIFGVVGRNAAPKRGGAGKGQAIAGLVLGGVAILLGIVGVIAINSFFDDPEYSSSNPADSSDYDVKLERCGVHESGEGEATGTIKNTSDEVQDFAIRVLFRSSEREHEGFDILPDLEPGESRDWYAVSFSAAPDLTCRVTVDESF
jgi:hypothetical protein